MESDRDTASIVATLTDAHASYPSLDNGSPYDEVLAEIQDRAQRTGSIGKADIGALMLWRRLNLSTIWTRELNKWPDREVRAVTEGAIELARDTSMSVSESAGAARSALLALPDTDKVPRSPRRFSQLERPAGWRCTTAERSSPSWRWATRTRTVITAGSWPPCVSWPSQ